ncbi:hypothetical protein EX30DRAFT_262526 [Ascodesmis nigricans]|uniref:Uncharacterized protein n=1 Tax=Ascodesmis nigricans TaxID=341454 RepID=A0A4S2MXS8_9PEZI|nr:hypothetical protein EX30DRAFT_262526 [Ascodesmis nigricans]
MNVHRLQGIYRHGLTHGLRPVHPSHPTNSNPYLSTQGPQARELSLPSPYPFSIPPCLLPHIPPKRNRQENGDQHEHHLHTVTTATMMPPNTHKHASLPRSPKSPPSLGSIPFIIITIYPLLLLSSLCLQHNTPYSLYSSPHLHKHTNPHPLPSYNIKNGHANALLLLPL